MSQITHICHYSLTLLEDNNCFRCKRNNYPVTKCKKIARICLTQVCNGILRFNLHQPKHLQMFFG